MQHQLRNSILATLYYSDIFDYPLKKEEVWKYLIFFDSSAYRISYTQFLLVLDDLVKTNKIYYQNDYYYLKERKRIVQVRKQRTLWSEEKFKKAKKIAQILSFIPTIRLLGVSGSLAMLNAKKHDDIDLFIIIENKTMWVTRCFVILLLQLLGVRRKRGKMQQISDSICANMFVDESKLTLPRHFQTLYGAHEVTQLVPLFDSHEVHTKFIRANSWIKEYLPNAFSVILNPPKADEESQSRNKSTFIWLFDYLLIWLFNLLEPLAHFVQYQYMKPHMTTEIVTNTLLAFHPKDFTTIIQRKFEERKKKYHV
jgi:D-beta-D-heptose 7-phosphate kinase/D-beta-D-heptose 1-phosphate adenosyltransferase